MKESNQIKETLFKRTQRVGDCLVWTGATDPGGYGHFGLNRKTVLAHRISYTIFNGPIPEGMCVCHTCDNRRCIEPKHLFVGTKKDNAQDAVSKGRLKKNDVKLNWAKVDEIRQRYSEGGCTHRSLATEFGVCNATIWDIINHNHWIK